MSAPIDALAVEAARTAAFLESLTADDWDRPTRCAPLTVFELTAHAWRGSGRVLELIAAGPVESEAEKDAATYFRYDADAEAQAIIERSKEASKSLDPSTAAKAWADAWESAIDAARDVDGIYQTIFGLMTMTEYLKTRVLEVTIHTMDLRDAVGMSPDPSEPGLTVTCEVLRGLLGADLRPLGVDDVRFALTGTGREPLDDVEKELLGPLAELFPVLR